MAHGVGPQHHGRVRSGVCQLRRPASVNRHVHDASICSSAATLYGRRESRRHSLAYALGPCTRLIPLSHSVINETRKSAWLKGFAVIEMGHYRRFYRQSSSSFAGAGDGAICAASTFSARLSIAIHLSALHPALERSSFLSLTTPPRVPLLPTRSRPRRHQRHAVRNLAA